MGSQVSMPTLDRKEEQSLQFNTIRCAKNFFFFNQIGIGALHCTVAVATIAFLLSINRSNAYFKLRQTFRGAIPPTQYAFTNNNVAFLTGKITYKPNKVIDPIFGVELPASRADSCGLYRKVEAFSNTRSWKDANYPWKVAFDATKSNPASKTSSQLFMNPTIRVDDMKIADTVLAPLMQQNTEESRIPISKEQIESHFEAIKENQYESILKLDSKEISEAIRAYSEHPFSQIPKMLGERIAKTMLPEYDGDYIYLRSNPGKQSIGDLRISFYDFGQLSEVTLLARKNGDLIDEYEVPNLKQYEAYKIKVERNGRVERVNADAMSFILNGIHGKDEMVKEAMKSIKSKGSFTTSLALALGIVALYALLEFVTLQGQKVNGFVKSEDETEKVRVYYPTISCSDSQFAGNSFAHLFGLSLLNCGFLSMGLLFSTYVVVTNFEQFHQHLKKTELINAELIELQLQRKERELQKGKVLLPPENNSNHTLRTYLLLE